MPVLEFLREMRAGSRSMSPLVLHPEDSFATAVELLAAAAVHRVYVVDGRKPVGVVALADVLRVIAPPHTHRTTDPSPVVTAAEVAAAGGSDTA